MTDTYPKPINPFRVVAIAIWARITKDATRGLHFLKCDRKGCPHIEFHHSLTDKHIGKPCPRCGDSLLTHEDAGASPLVRTGPLQ